MRFKERRRRLLQAAVGDHKRGGRESGGMGMRPVYAVWGGVSKFAGARPELDFRGMVKEAYDYALTDLHLTPQRAREIVDGTICSYFSDHFTRQLKAGSMVQDYLGLCPKPGKRIEGGGATGGLAVQSGWEAVASGRVDICVGG